MVSPLLYSHLALLALIWLFVLLPLRWPRRSATPPPVPGTPSTPTRTRSTAPTAFAGLTHQPHGALGERETGETPPAPPQRPAPLPPTDRRPRTVDTARHWCPHPACASRGGLGRNHLRATGHPPGGPWRQVHGTACAGDCPDHHGTLCHGTQAAVERLGRVVACRAEGLSLRATARVVAGAPNTGVHWRVDAAAPRLFRVCPLCSSPGAAPARRGVRGAARPQSGGEP
jgi:hypothetical protein